jgi:MFS family permease
MSTAPGLLSRRYRRISIAIYMMVALSAFENLGVLAATPQIAEDLGDVALLPWIVTGYLAANAVASVTSGKFIDGVGVRLVFRVGVAVFMIGSVLAAFSPSMQFLIGARIIHGIGGGLVFASSLSAVSLVYPPELVGRGYAANSTVWGVLGVAGPAIAALILTVMSWEWIFLLIVPLGLVGGALAWSTLPGPVEGSAVLLDRRGTALVSVIFVSLVLAVGWLSTGSLAMLVVAVMAALAYRWHHGREAHPVVQLRHLAARPYGALNLGVGLLLAGAIGAHTYTPLYVAGARNGSSALVAWSVLFVTIGWTGGANVAALFRKRETAPLIATIGPSLTAAALLTASVFVFAGQPLWMLFATLTMVGAGIGATTNTTLQMIRYATPDAELGRVTTVHDLGRNTGFTLGVAVGGAVLLIVLGNRIANIEIVRSLLAGDTQAGDVDAAGAVASAYGTALMVGAVITSLSVPVLATLRKWNWTQPA